MDGSKYDNDRKEKKRGNRKKRDKYTWLYQLKRLPLLALIPLGLLLPKLVAKLDPQKVEKVYSRGIYPVIANVLGFLSSLVPFSLAEALIVIALTIIAAVFIIRLLKIPFGKVFSRGRNRIRFFSFVISLGIFAGVMLNLFYLLWGFNHYRVPLTELMELDVKKRSKQELALAYEKLTDEAIRLRELVAEDKDGIFDIGDAKEGLRGVVNSYETLGKENELFKIKPYAAKKVFLSKELSKLNIAGIYIPYTAEPNVNAEQPDLYFLGDAAHEIAHHMGFAKEEDANFIAYYSSLYSSDPSVKYSAVMQALSYVGSTLLSEDSELYYSIRNRYTDAMNRDLAVYSIYYKKYEKHPAKKVNDTINDAYLVYNGETDGIKSYGRMVDLILAYFEKQGR